ncbi:hypothetical protein EJ05DRAFT_472127 [Pseudovirgaria hyperparasitica]|uniref:DRBM domain-containing protein n=1 Tax=Pseudovirgaria hyperparasitica TaxID=470096 RepID=A0A6A6WM54_9PEZI|nr:uncharacterized protein EJ05DRAFT_472127 [Pseudovirgaria hyperparasitica]KAF2763216.1 hypothetical protein EJ05DRAFT_472127 [Pseudovirgaria hyperparasitica]
MAQARPSSWQEKLRGHCQQLGYRPPVWNEVSDRRGGRTAWSSVVTVQGEPIPARYWYDGQYVENAREDAAEVALQRLGATNGPLSPEQRLYGGLSPGGSET